ncbi:RND family transporter [Paenibacillus sp. NPDC057886]|uniref:efflux RND transporter permease subunit n=1 Tax=Paenibacillus sp. NPDC057886 TaxID=3346270 RepID=UPI0036CAB788
MFLKNLFNNVGMLITKRAIALVIIMALITGGMGYGLTRIEVKTSVDMLLSKDSPVSIHNERFQNQFGGESLVLLLRGSDNLLLNNETLVKLNSLQQELSASDRVFSVTSPVSIADAFAQQAEQQSSQMQEQMTNQIQQAMTEAAAAVKIKGGDEKQQAHAADAAKQQVEQAIAAQYGEQIRQMNEIGELTSTNEAFVRYALFDESGAPQKAVAQLLPENGKSILFNIQLKSGLTLQEMSEATDQLEQIIKAHSIEQTHSLFSGIPAISKTIDDFISKDIVTMLLTVIILMIIVLLLIFPVRWRLLSLPVVMIGMVWVFGLMGYMGMPLSIATMALLPILIGLGTDFALQFHNRYEEELVKKEDSSKAMAAAVRHMAPAVGIAVIIMAAGFLTLLFSEMPMIKDFGLMLAVGVCIMYAVGLFLLLPLLILRDRKGIKLRKGKAGNVVERALGGLAKYVIEHPKAMLIIPLIVAIAGFSVDHKLNVESNIEKLMPQKAPALVELNEIREVMGNTLTLDWMIEAQDVTRPEIIQWMDSFQKHAVTDNPQITESSSIINAMSAIQPDVVTADSTTIGKILDQLPSEITAPYLSEDRGMAHIIFTIDNVSTQDQEMLLSRLEQYSNLPDGVSANPVGIQVLQVKSLNGLTDSRHTSLFSGLIAILLGLFIVYRSFKRAFFPILPIILVNGWSTALLFILGIDINPLTAVLGALVLGIGTEFTILFMERYLEEKANGLDKKAAIVTAMTKVGRAITASGLTVVGGFSALMFTNFEVVKLFGVTTVLDTLLCLLSTLIVLPAIIVLLDKDKGVTDMSGSDI